MRKIIGQLLFRPDKTQPASHPALQRFIILITAPGTFFL